MKILLVDDEHGFLTVMVIFSGRTAMRLFSRRMGSKPEKLLNSNMLT